MGRVMVQEVVKQIAAPAPIVQAPIVEYARPAPIVETFAPAPIMAAPMMTAPVVETFAPTYAAPLVGSMRAPLAGAMPMTTMAAPATTIGAPFVGTSYGLPPTIL